MRDDSTTEHLEENIETRAWYKQALNWYFSGIRQAALVIITAALLVLFGLNSFNLDSPIVQFAITHLPLTLALLLLFLAINFVTWKIYRNVSAPAMRRRTGYRVSISLLAGLGGFTLLNVLVLVTLVTMILIRPAWCWSFVCKPAPPARVVTVLSKNDIHDAHLDVYLNTIQNHAVRLQELPQSYTRATLPQLDADHIATNTMTVLTGTATSATSRDAYQVVLGVHSLEQGRSNITIDQVRLRITRVEQLPFPLNVWVTPPGLVYNSEPFLIQYTGQATGTSIKARFVPLPGSYVQLKPGEGDSLDIQVVSLHSAAFTFQLDVTYRIDSDPSQITLTLPTLFTVIFCRPGYWNPYVLAGNQLAPAAVTSP